MVDSYENTSTKLNRFRWVVEDIDRGGPSPNIVRSLIDCDVEVARGSKLMEVVCGRSSSRAGTYDRASVSNISTDCYKSTNRPRQLSLLHHSGSGSLYPMTPQL